jgi:hypothetical protein
MALNADLWTLVFGFALDLETLDASCLLDLASFALVERSASAALKRLVARTAQLKLRARIHRLLGFKKVPGRTELRLLFPRFLPTLPPKVTVPLTELSRRIAGSEQGEDWVDWAELRPRRLAVRKRNREHRAEEYAKRQALLKQQLSEHGLPFSETSPAVTDFCQGRVDIVDHVFGAMKRIADDLAAEAFIDARDAQARDAEARDAELQRLAKHHGVVVPQEPLPPWSAGHLLAHMWLRQITPPIIVVRCLDRPLKVRAGHAIRLLGVEELGVDHEAELWLQAARDVLAAFTGR